MNFYISISNGLLKNDHEKRMGAAIWQYMWLIDKITKIDDKGFGWVLGGKPIQLDEIAENKSRDTVSRNLKRLESEGYINIKRTPYGLVISVNKAKKRFGKSAERIDKNVEPLRKNVESIYKVLDNNRKTLTKTEIEKIKNKIPKLERYLNE